MEEPIKGEKIVVQWYDETQPIIEEQNRGEYHINATINITPEDVFTAEKIRAVCEFLTKITKAYQANKQYIY